MRCILITPTFAHQHTWDDVVCVRASSETGALAIYPNHAPFFAVGRASPLRVLREHDTEEIFTLLQPTYRVEKTSAGETIVTITAQRAFWKETDVHLTLKAYGAHLQEMLKEQGLSRHERIFIEDEISGTRNVLSKKDARE